MPITESGMWVPVLDKQQVPIFNSYSRFNLVSGPRKSGKTVAVLKRLVRHGWETPRARVGFFTKYIKNAKVGAWDILYSDIIPEWLDLEGFRVSKKMSMDGTTRMHYFRIADQHGFESEFQLHSLDNENEIAEKLKSTVFSCVFINELTNFRTSKAFVLAKEQLRMPHLKYDDHIWIADTNPDEEEGDNFWAYKIWYEETKQADHPYPEYQKQLNLIECTLDGNTFLDPREKDDLKASYRNDPDLYAVYVDGKWLQASTDSFFSGVFSMQRHVIGHDGEEMAVEDAATTLYTGWDLGDRNHSMHILEKVQIGEHTFWKVLDELVTLASDTSIEDFTLMALDMMDDWEEMAGRKMQWRHWSDTTASERFRSSAGTWDDMIVYKATQGRIKLESAPKFSGSQRLRVQLVRQLMLEDRLIIGPRCEMLIGALRGGLKKGKKQNEYIASNRFKHGFDSATYPILAESAWDIGAGDSMPMASGLAGFGARL